MYSDLISLGQGELGVFFTYSDKVISNGKHCEIQVRVKGNAGDSDIVQVFQFFDNDNEGRLIGDIALNGENEVVKSFYVIKSKEFYIGLKMTDSSLETPNYSLSYVVNQGVESRKDRLITTSEEYTGFTFKIKGDQFTLPLRTNYIYDCIIYWGDGTFTEQKNDISPTHFYPSDSTYTIEIIGILPYIYFNNSGDKDKLVEIVQWGNIEWQVFRNSFYGCSNLISVYGDTAFTSSVSDMSQMFRDCVSLVTVDVSGFDTSNVTNILGMFSNCSSMVSAPDVSGFDTSNVTNMSGMFQNCSSMVFAPDVSGFDTSNVTNMQGMFQNCSSMVFAPDVSGFDTSNVTTFRSMLRGLLSTNFNVNIGSWNVTSLTDATSMFFETVIPTSNYDNLLIGWEGQSVQNNVNFHGGSSKYSAGAAAAARAALIADHSWTISDDGQV